MKKWDWIIFLVLGFGIGYLLWGRGEKIETVYEPTQEILELQNKVNELQERNDSLQAVAIITEQSYAESIQRTNAELRRIRLNYPDLSDIRATAGMDTGRYSIHNIISSFREQASGGHLGDTSYWAVFRAEVRDSVRQQLHSREP